MVNPSRHNTVIPDSDEAWFIGFKRLCWVMMTIGLVVRLQACGPVEQLVGHAHPTLPPDFALRFHVAGDPRADDLLLKTSQYLVEPNRQFRVALGAGATIDYYPKLTRRSISRAEFYELCQHVHLHHLMSEPTSVGSEGGGVNIRYAVEISAQGRTHRYRTTPDESPPTVELLRLLIALHHQP